MVFQTYKADALDCALDLLRRLPPTDIASNIQKILSVNPDLQEDLLSSVDQPLSVAKCVETGKDFLKCDYNRDGDSYRSPWSGEYQPRTDGYKPAGKYQQLEQAANDAFTVYCDLYYGGSLSSVYVWELEDGFAAAVLIKKSTDSNATWDSTHIIEVLPAEKSANYKLTSTIMLHMNSKTGVADNEQNVDLGGSLTRQVEFTNKAEMSYPIDSFNSHIPNIGRMIEEMENKMRNTVQEIYFGKTQDILNELKSAKDLSAVKRQNALQAQLMAQMKSKN